MPKLVKHSVDTKDLNFNELQSMALEQTILKFTYHG